VWPGGRASGATDPLNLYGAAGVGVGTEGSWLGTRATSDVGVCRTLDGFIRVDLTNGRLDGGSSANRIALVDCSVDGDFVDITVSGDKRRKDEREKCGCDHDERARTARGPTKRNEKDSESE
jgi:hypothetical protein